MSVTHIKNYIGGKLLDPVSGNWIPNYEPATGNIYSEVPDSGEQDVANAVDAAEVALETWSRAPVDERVDVLHRLADLIDQNREELVAIESRDNGKPENLRGPARYKVPSEEAEGNYVGEGSRAVEV